MIGYLHPVTRADELLFEPSNRLFIAIIADSSTLARVVGTISII